MSDVSIFRLYLVRAMYLLFASDSSSSFSREYGRRRRR